MKIPIVALKVLDQERALRFYTDTLGFTKVDDMEFPGMRWLTVAPPGQDDVHVLLERVGPPVVDEESARQIDTLIAKGVMGTLFLEVDDCRGLFDQVVAKGVEVIQEPKEQFYGIDAAFRDDSGNHVRITERVATSVAPHAQG